MFAVCETLGCFQAHITHAYVNKVISIKDGCQKNWLHSNNSFLYPAVADSANKRVGRLVSSYKLPRSGVQLYCIYFCLSRLYH